jgi:hypothetical protein
MWTRSKGGQEKSCLREKQQCRVKSKSSVALSRHQQPFPERKKIIVILKRGQGRKQQYNDSHAIVLGGGINKRKKGPWVTVQIQTAGNPQNGVPPAIKWRSGAWTISEADNVAGLQSIDLPDDIIVNILDFLTGASEESPGVEERSIGRSTVIQLQQLKSLSTWALVSKRASEMVAVYTRNNLIDADFYALPSSDWFDAIFWLAKRHSKMCRINIGLGRHDKKMIVVVLEGCDTSHLKVFRAPFRPHGGSFIVDAYNVKRFGTIGGHYDLMVKQGPMMEGHEMAILMGGDPIQMQAEERSDLEFQRFLSWHLPSLEELFLTVTMNHDFDMADELFRKPSLLSLKIGLHGKDRNR